MFSRAALLLSVFFGIAVNSPVWSQIITGSMRGVVTDRYGQPLPGATVLISSKTQSGLTRNLSTNDLGVFQCPALPVGTYSVEARLDGFQNVRANEVEVDLDKTTNVPLKMKLAVSETIEVVGDIPMIDSQNAGVPTYFKQEMVENVPTSRHMWILMQVAPGLTTDHNDGLDSAIIAFGSNRQSNSWNIDGLDITNPETGNPRFEANPDMIEQLQVYGLGAPAEYGNHTGAILNVITKKGTNDLHGGFNSFFQSQAFTGTNVRLPDSDFVFHRDKYYDVTGQIGGPLLKDKIWFFGAAQSKRDAYSNPGNNPDYTPLTTLDRYDLKVNARVAKRYDISGFFHDEDYDLPEPTNPFYTKSALAHSFGGTSAWGVTLTSAFYEKFLLEMGYAGWWGESLRGSQTGSLESPLELTEPDSFKLIGYSGGIRSPRDQKIYRHQIRAKTTYYADEFLNSQHEFRFGVQYFYGSSVQASGMGPNGSTYSDGYDYGDPGFRKSYQTPYFSGGVSDGLGFFVDDTVTLNQRVTLNLGIRFDHNTGSIPDFDRLEVGTPSVTEIGNFRRTGEIISGIKNLVRWNLFSPRLGFVWRTREDGRAVLRGSFGVYYDHDTTGNWNSPPPEMSSFKHYYVDGDGQSNFIGEGFRVQFPRDQQLRAPRALQYSVGYEFQPTDNSSIGLQFVHKDSTNLIGWQIVGGQWKTVPFIDPFTGREYTLLFPEEGTEPIIHMGNDPGDFPGSERLRYFHKYDGVILTFTKRFADSWTLNASYTWSKSNGLIPTMFSEFQYQPLFGSIEGTDPNNFINATGRLQGDRPHMFRAQVVFFKLPWDLQTAASVDFSSGTPYTRQIFAQVDPFGGSRVIMEPAGSLRHSPVQNIDLSIGKRFSIGNRLEVAVDAEVLNLLNSDQELQFATLFLESPTDTFVPIEWVAPRRLQLQVGFQF